MRALIDALLAWLRPAAPANPANPANPVHAAAAEFIAPWEGFRANPYMPTPNDRPTIGYGTTRYPNGVAVTLADPPCTEAKALSWLAHDVADAAQAVADLVTAPLTDGQRVALISFTYNCGQGALASSTLLRLLNGGWYGDARREFARWNKQRGIVLNGLVKRRAAEAELFGGAP